MKKTLAATVKLTAKINVHSLPQNLTGCDPLESVLIMLHGVESEMAETVDVESEEGPSGGEGDDEGETKHDAESSSLHGGVGVDAAKAWEAYVAEALEASSSPDCRYVAPQHLLEMVRSTSG